MRNLGKKEKNKKKFPKKASITERKNNKNKKKDFYEFDDSRKVDFSRFDQPDRGDHSDSNENAPENDEEIDEDNAFNSEDEAKYGELFDQAKGKRKIPSRAVPETDDSIEGEEDEEGEVMVTDLLSKLGSPVNKISAKPTSNNLTDSEDEEEGDHEKLLDFISTLPPDKEKRKRNTKDVEDGSKGLKESELGYIRSGDSTASLTMDALVDSISGTKGFGAVKKQFQTLKRTAKPLAPTAAAVVEERIQRETVYEESKKDVDKWQQFIKHNRDVETLDLTGRINVTMTSAALVDKFQPSTDMEKEIHELLATSLGADYRKNKADSDSENDLGRNEIAEEDVGVRHGELAKLRALISYQAQKSVHMKKIKSKTYRRVRKRKRERDKEEQTKQLKEHDPDAARELAEQSARNRVAERMTLRHKNQGKWAKLALQRGINNDKDTKQAIVEQHQLHQQLRKKIDSVGQENSDSEADSEPDAGLSSKDRAELLKIGTADIGQEIEEYEGKGKAIFKMKFMQRAMESQREQAKLQAQQLLEELEGVDSEESERENKKPKHDEHKGSQKRSIQEIARAKEAVALALPDGSLQARNLMTSTGTRVRASGVISVDLGSNNPAPDQDLPSNENLINVCVADEQLHEKPKPYNPSGLDKALGVKKTEENPWLAQSTSKRANISSASKNETQVVNLDMRVPSEQAKTVIHKDAKPQKSTVTTNTTLNGQVSQEVQIAELSQEELIRRAFVAPDLVEEFKKEKEDEINEGTKTEATPADLGVQGWGSWAGLGAPPPPKNPSHDQPKKKVQKSDEKTIAEKRRDARLPTVIIYNRRIKKSAKYKVGSVPYPFTSREQYEKAMRHPIGPEWNTTQATKSMTKPEVLTRAGKVIEPGKLTKSVVRKHRLGELPKLGQVYQKKKMSKSKL